MATMQCTVFIPAKNEEMTKHTFYDEWEWCTLENTNVLFDNFEYAIPFALYISNRVAKVVTVHDDLLTQ